MNRKIAKVSLLSAALLVMFGTAHAAPIPFGSSAKYVEVATIPATATGSASAANIVVITKQPVRAGSPHPSDELITLVDSRGPVYSVDETTGAVKTIMDLRTATSGLVGSTATAGNAELGVRGLAYHPDFATPGAAGYLKFYTMSCHATSTRTLAGAIPLNHNIPPSTAPIDAGKPRPSVPCDNVLSEWQMKAPSATNSGLTRDTAVARREVLRFPQMYTNHGTDALVFDPLTKLLYIAAGDGGGQGDPLGVASNPAYLYGKILRFNPLKPGATVPTSMKKSNDGHWSYPINNPGYGNPGRDAYYIRGFRHPETMFISGRDLIVADIGGSKFEEINVVKLHPGEDVSVATGDEGKSFGWDGVEGRLLNTEANTIPDSEMSSTIPPVSGYFTDGVQHTRPAAIIVGGVPVNTMGAAFNGQLIFGDIVSGRIFYGSMSDMKARRTWPMGMVAIQEVDLYNNAGARASLMTTYGRNSRVDLRLSEINGTIYGTTKQTGKLFKLMAR